MNKEKEIHNLLKYLQSIYLFDELVIDQKALKKAIDLLIEYKRLVTVKDKDASHHINKRKEIRNLFNLRYNQKALELTGKTLNEDNKRIYPRWDAKTNSLLKIDYEEIGCNTLKKYIELFFSDEVEAVANFTKKVTKAGYSYTIFHSMISKLAIYPKEPSLPCEFCGRRNGHAPSCKISLQLLEEVDKKHKEEDKIRNEIQNVSLLSMLHKNIGVKHGTN